MQPKNSSIHWHFWRNRLFLLTKNALLQKGPKNSGMGRPSPLIRAMPERKRLFSIDVFPYLIIITPTWKSSCQELYCLDNYYRRRMPKVGIRTLLHHHRHSKIDRRYRTCFNEIKMHRFHEKCMVVRILWQQHHWKNSWWLGHHWSPLWRKVNYVHSQSWKPHLTASQSRGSFKQGQLKIIS